jgi:hypothetical protein
LRYANLKAGLFTEARASSEGVKRDSRGYNVKMLNVPQRHSSDLIALGLRSECTMHDLTQQQWSAIQARLVNGRASSATPSRRRPPRIR